MFFQRFSRSGTFPNYPERLRIMSHTKHHFDENLCTAITFRLAIPLTNKSQEAQESSFFRRIAQALLTITNAQPHELLPTLNIIIDDVRNERPYRQGKTILSMNTGLFVLIISPKSADYNSPLLPIVQFKPSPKFCNVITLIGRLMI